MAAPGPLRPRYARVVSPGDDSTVQDLWLGIVLRVMFLAIFIVQALFTDSLLWRVVSIVLALVWVRLIADCLTRLRRAERP